MHRAGAGVRDDRFRIALHPPAAQLHAVAFEVVEAADAVADAFGLAHGARDLCRDPALGAVTLQRGAGGGFDLVE